MEYKRSEAKEWAKGYFKGVQATLLPSFTPDNMVLDEAGVRNDVRQEIKHGFFSTICVATNAGLTMDEARIFVQWSVDEAKNRIGIGLELCFNTLEDNIKMAKFAEEIGCCCLFFVPPSNFHPQNPQEVYDYVQAICRATNLGVEILPPHQYDLGVFQPALLNRIADIENMVAMKVGANDLAWIDECFRLFGDRMLCGYTWDDGWPTYIRKYGMQFAASAPYQVFQSPDDPREVRLFQLIQAGKMDEATELLHKIEIIRKPFQQSVNSTPIFIMQLWKYLEGLTGMTGGEMRPPKVGLTRPEKEMWRKYMRDSGLKIMESKF